MPMRACPSATTQPPSRQPRPDARQHRASPGASCARHQRRVHVHFLRRSLRLTQIDLMARCFFLEVQCASPRYAIDNPAMPAKPWIQGCGWQYAVMPGGR